MIFAACSDYTGGGRIASLASCSGFVIFFLKTVTRENLFRATVATGQLLDFYTPGVLRGFFPKL